jgi:hypothetical protein
MCEWATRRILYVLGVDAYRATTSRAASCVD